MSQEIAQQLFNNPNKEFVTQQLLSKNDKSLLNEFISLIEIEKNDTMVKCLQKLLEKIVVPNKASELDVLCETYALKLFNTKQFPSESSSGLYVLLYSMLMLKEDLSSTKLTKMSLNDFIKVNRNINSGKDFSQDFLSQIYGEIKLLYYFMPLQQIVIPEVFNVDRTCQIF